MGLVIPSDLIAEDLKKTARKGTGFMGLQKKLFGTENKKEKKEAKALTEAKVNSNTRTLAMVLKSERELLSANKEQELEIDKLKLMLEDKNREVSSDFVDCFSSLGFGFWAYCWVFFVCVGWEVERFVLEAKRRG